MQEVRLERFNPRWEAASRATSLTRWLACTEVSIPDGKPPHVRRTDRWYSRTWLYGFQSQMGSRLTCDVGTQPIQTRLVRFQSQMGSRLTCDASIAAWHARSSRVSIPDGKPPHVRRHGAAHTSADRKEFQSQMGSRLTCDMLRSACSSKHSGGFNPRWEAASRATQAVDVRAAMR